MKLLHLPHGYWPAVGGAESLCRELSEGVARLDNDVRVVVADLMSPEGLYRFGEARTGRTDETINGVHIRRVGLGPEYRIGSSASRRDPYSASVVPRWFRRRSIVRLEDAIRSELRDYRPDVVFTLPHLFENVRAVFRVHREQSFPLVWMPLLHESDPYWPFEDIKRSLPQADAVVALTSSEAEKLVSRYGADPDRVHVISPGVHTPIKLPDKVGQDSTVLFLGRVTATKNIDILGAAMSIVWHHHPRTRLVVAGASAADTQDVLATMQRITGPEPESIAVHLDVTDDVKNTLLRQATMLALPSQRESYGMVLLEAWAHATPVVAMTSSVTREVVTDGVDGLLAGTEGVTQFAQAISTLLEDPQRTRQMGIRGYERVKLDRTWQAAAQDLAAIYSSIK